MAPHEIREQIRRRPFQPFRVHLANGSSYEVYHPELILVTQTLVVIANATDEDEIPADKAFCDPYQITHIEPLERGDSRRRQPAES